MKRAPIKSLPDAAELHRIFSYESGAGILRWKSVRRYAHRIEVGGIAGTVSSCGYLKVGIGRSYYAAHRIIWKMMTGTDPADQIDHIDGDRLNNRWTNLRAATNGQNRWNIKRQKNNRSGVTGVCPERGGWKAYISAGHGQQDLGRFKNKNDAIMARRAAVEKLHAEFTRAA